MSSKFALDEVSPFFLKQHPKCLLDIVLHLGQILQTWTEEITLNGEEKGPGILSTCP